MNSNNNKIERLSSLENENYSREAFGVGQRHNFAGYGDAGTIKLKVKNVY